MRLWSELFQFTHPGRGATRVRRQGKARRGRFNSRTPGGVRLLKAFMTTILQSRFNSRTPGGVRRVIMSSSDNSAGFNSRTPGGVRPDNLTSMVSNAYVSIHAPREGCDGARSSSLLDQPHVSIHAPREGCDLRRKTLARFMIWFQFTHPGRGATSSFSTANIALTVSIHAPREGCDKLSQSDQSCLYGFNSRTPGGVRL